MRQLVVQAALSEKRIAFLEDGKLQALELIRPTDQALPGDLYYAQVEKIDRKTAACFLNLGKEKAFLHLKDIPNGKTVTQGARFPVMIVREGNQHKLPLATGWLEFSGELLVFMPYKGYQAFSKRLDQAARKQLTDWLEDILQEEDGILFRSKAGSASKEALLAEWEMLQMQFQQLQAQITRSKKTGPLSTGTGRLEDAVQRMQQTYQPDHIYTDTKLNFLKQAQFQSSRNIFDDFAIEAAINKLTQQEVLLPNGTTIFIEKTEAMWVIDVNSAQFRGNFSKQEAVARINQEAVPEIFRQIRLRNMSGLIVIDFINHLDPTDDLELTEKVETYAAKETITTQIANYSKSGLMQLTRRKRKKSWLEETHQLCPVCKGTGHVASALTFAYQLERELSGLYRPELNIVLVVATEDVLSAFLDLGSFSDAPIEWEIAEEAVPFYQILQVE
ncbi:Rne/Rng family ribonuclease [Listeria costaricensis]|uniref:ribonuclease E/G n=1 Tax=Listeria costaricensis TaxID=2026604 RepID=UPI000C06BEB1|nr:ribonuclease E/G [Listeria costaricensis]